nr:hypothetical protein [Candidatus Njordarchaeum guaymaensis]
MSMDSGKRRTIVLGCVFLLFLLVSYVENTSFFVYIRDSFTNPPLAVALVFIHNVLAISLIVLGMAFYVEVVLSFMPKRKIEYVVLQNPEVFAAVFAVMIILISVLRASTLVRGQVEINTLAFVVLLSLPAGLVEGYGIFQAIKKTLKKALTLRSLALIYLIFLIAAVIEVGFVQVLLWASTR